MSHKTKAAKSGGYRAGAERMNCLTHTRILPQTTMHNKHFYSLRRQAEKKMDRAVAAGDDDRQAKHFRVWLAMLEAERGR